MAMAVHPGKKSPAGLRAVGRYELKEKLGEGGMGVVWRAFDARIGSDVALKIMKDCSDPAALEMFSKEWRALAELSHPNIVDVRDADVLEEDGEQKPFFVMPLLRGTTLSDLIASSSERLTVKRVVDIVTQVCRGLQAAHQRGLIHRDLKPSNIFVMDDDTAKVIDFGVVYLAGTHSITGRKGTFQYMSPEQMQMKEVTPASDLFAMGVILYESLTGRKPFAFPTVEETSQAVMKLIPPPASEINPGIPHSVSQVVHKCLAKQAIHRFSSAKDLSDTLQRAFRGEEVFDASKLRMRLERVKSALKTDEGFASELLSELESEGHQDAEISLLRSQIDVTMKQRKIRQLMESARARIEQDEIPLGLDKLREVLALDPDNVDALALKASTESKRNEAQATRWVELATTHLGNCDFVAARQAIQEALTSRPGDARALELMNRIDTVESEAKRIREQKEDLYNTALRAYQNGEIDSALSRMARLFSVGKDRPEGAIPERDAVFESFYQQVRSEHDSIRAVLEEAQRHFADENFQQALGLCGQHLAKYPNDGVFQALKIQIEDAERQKVSSYIAEVTKTADAEPDLDRRANILREACERYPNEAQFAQQLKVVRERRDLVNSIVAKARQFGERGQYGEEFSQWDMLRNIHPRYPGLDFELQQCRKRKDQQAGEEEKARMVEEIVRLMEARNFPRALERARIALSEFPGDTELEGLAKLSTDGLGRFEEAAKLLTLGQAEAAARNWNESTEYLRKALKLDQKNAAIKETLVNVLTEQARTLLDSDFAEANRLYQEAAAVDGNHRTVRTLGTEISEGRRQTYVGQCLTDARARMADGDTNAAFEVIRKGREEYPNDSRLKQYESILLKENQQLRVRQDRDAKLAALKDAQQRLELAPDSEKARDVLRHTRELNTFSPDDPDLVKRIADAEQTVRNLTGRDDLDSLLDRTAGTVRNAPPDDLAATRLIEQKKTAEQPKAKKEAPKESAAAVPADSDALRNRNRMIGMAGAFVLFLVVAGLLIRHFAGGSPPAPPPPIPEASAKVHVNVTPTDSSVRVNGIAAPNGEVTVPSGHNVQAEVSRAGYKTATLTLDAKSAVQTIALTPLPARITVATGEKSGEVQLDGTKVADLVDGVAGGIEVPVDGQSHTVAVVGGKKHIADLKLKTAPGARPELEPLGNQNILVVTSIGTDATFEGGPKLKTVSLNGTPINLSPNGNGVLSLTNGANELAYTTGNDTASLSLSPTEMPAVMVHVPGAAAVMLITANVDDAILTVNGKLLKRSHGSWQISQPGTYNFSLSANQYVTQTWTAVLKPNKPVTDQRTLVAVPPTEKVSPVSVAGGTPGARVEIDGRPAGEIGANGVVQLTRPLSAGPHSFIFRKEGFCDVRTEVVAKPPAEARITAARMEPCGSLTFRPSESQATARVRNADDTSAKWIALPIGQRVQLPTGKYEAQVDFPGKNSLSLPDLQVTQKDAEFAPRPPGPRLQPCGVQNANEVTDDGGWLKPNGNNWVSLTPGCVNVGLTFAKPKGGFLGHKKVEWMLYAGGGSGRIAYELDGNKLTRKVTTAGKEPERIESKVALDGDAESYSVRVQVEGQRVLIKNAKGETVDDFTADSTDLVNLRGGRIGIRTNAAFKVGGGI